MAGDRRLFTSPPRLPGWPACPAATWPWLRRPARKRNRYRNYWYHSSHHQFLQSTVDYTSVLCRRDTRQSVLRAISCRLRRSPSANAAHQLHCGLLNVRSLGGGTAAVIQERLLSSQLDVFVAVETWHDYADSPSLNLACPRWLPVH